MASFHLHSLAYREADLRRALLQELELSSAAYMSPAFRCFSMEPGISFIDSNTSPSAVLYLAAMLNLPISRYI